MIALDWMTASLLELSSVYELRPLRVVVTSNRITGNSRMEGAEEGIEVGAAKGW